MEYVALSECLVWLRDNWSGGVSGRVRRWDQSYENTYLVIYVSVFTENVMKDDGNL